MSKRIYTNLMRFAVFMHILLIPVAAFANPERIALIIGNSGYTGEARLKNAVGDAELIAATFLRLGFETTLIRDLTTTDSVTHLGTFEEKAAAADIAVIYYAGHGMAVSGQNYLLPVDADVSSEQSLIETAVPLSRLMSIASDAKLFGVVLFDACRTDPRSDDILLANGSKGTRQGLLSEVSTPVGVVLGFAAAQGQVAYDGAGNVGPYAEALHTALQENPNREISLLLENVTGLVGQATGQEQQPTFQNNIARMNASETFRLVGSVAVSSDTTSSVESDVQAGLPVTYLAGGGDEQVVEPALENPSIAFVTECDRLAGFPRRPRVEGGSIPSSEMDAQAALRACKIDIFDYPEEPFLYFILARAQAEIDNTDPTILEYVRRGWIADDGFALDLYARVAFDGLAGVERNRDMAFQLALMAAQNDYPQSLITIGDRFKDNEPIDPARADFLYRAAQDFDLPEASAKIAWLMMNYLEDEPDYAEVRGLYQVAGDAGFAWAINNLGVMDQRGQGLPEPSAEMAVARFEQACTLDHALACRNAGHLLNDTDKPTYNDSLALEYFERSCELNDTNACANIGWMHRWRDVPGKSDEIALSRLREGCDAGEAWACGQTGSAILDGLTGNAPNYEEALAFMERGCQGGSGWSCQNAGHLLNDTDKPTYNDSRALEYFERGCELNDVNACANIGWMHRWRDVPGKSDEIALSRLREGCDAGEAWACGQTGSAILDGLTGNAPNYEEALAFMERGCQGGSGWSCSELGELFFFADGTDWNPPINGEAALRYFEEAHRLGSEQGTANLIALLGKVPITTAIVDPDQYNWETSSPTQRDAARRDDLIHAILWAQAIGLLPGTVERESSTEQLIQIVSNLSTTQELLTDPIAAPLVLEAQERAKRLLEHHIDVMEAEMDGGWAWGRLGGRTADLLSSLYGVRLGHETALEDDLLRNRLLIVQSKLTAEWNPNGFGRGDGTYWGFPTQSAQRNLEAVGISVGGVDGALGPATRRGIRSFQESIGLPVTGDIDPVTFFAVSEAATLGLSFR